MRRTFYPEVVGNVVYVGENNAENATRLTVKGTYKGKPVVYNTTLQKNLANIAIKRNTSYVLTLSPISETDFTVDVTVDTWGDDQILDNGVFVPHGTYYSVDFHNHTQFTDGANRLMFVLNQGKKYGLDIIVNSEHGGSSTYNAAAEGEWNGNDEYHEGSTSPRWNEWITSTGWDRVKYGNGNNMWRWQTIRDFSWPTLQKFNSVNSTSILAVQGLVWNPPGHEHCSMGVITGQFDGANSADAQAQFEYMFDNSDTDIEGGAGYQSAIVGGLWDAMLSEGRHFWLVANSDFHNHVSQNDGDFYP